MAGNELDIILESVPEQPWTRYDVVTGHGSRLTIYFKHDKNIISPETKQVICKGGDLHTCGFAESIETDVNLWGLGFEPEIDGHVAVGIIGKYPDGSHKLTDEMITNITRIQEVGHPPQEN